MVLKFLNKPYPYYGNIKRAVISNFFAGCFVALFLLFFQPFGTAQWQTENKVLKLLGFGLVSFIMPLLIQASLILFFRRERLEDKWRIGYEIVTILVILLSVTTGNMLYGRIIGTFQVSFMGFLWTFLSVCMIGFFPVTLHVVLKHNRYLRLHLISAGEVNKQIEIHHHEEPLSQTGRVQDTQNGEEISDTKAQTELADLFEIVAENGKDKIQLQYTDLLYIESADNYSNIVSQDGLKIRKQLVRSSLKRTEEFIKHPSVMRCHRAFIVNLQKVNRVEGNAAGYKLILADYEEPIPVSRTYATGVLTALKELN